MQSGDQNIQVHNYCWLFFWSFEDGFVATSGKSSLWVVAEKILRSLGASHHLQPINLAHSNFLVLFTPK
jgi:hypothetical protein